MATSRTTTESESDDPTVILRRCRPWLEKSGPEPVESDKMNYSKKGKQRRRGRRIGDRPQPDYVPNTLVPFGRVVMVGFLLWESYRRIAAWVSRRSEKSKQIVKVDGQHKMIQSQQSHEAALQLLAQPDPRTGMVLQRLSGKTGFPMWARQPVQPDRIDAAIQQQYKPPERASRQRRMVMVPREGPPPPEVWLEQQKEEEERLEARGGRKPPPRKAQVPHRRMTLLERAARGVGTRFDVDPHQEAAQKLGTRKKKLQQQVQQRGRADGTDERTSAVQG